MNRTELLELIANQENSRVEFERDDCHPDLLAREMSALLNLKGGIIPLGVEMDRSVSGLTRDREEAEKWVMNIAQNNLQLGTIPTWTTIAMGDGKVVGIVKLRANKTERPYKAKKGMEWVTYIRVGTTSRRATREEEGRLYQAAGLVRYELKAIPNMELDSLEFDRVSDYFHNILNRSIPNKNNVESWQQLLTNSDLMLRREENACATVAGLLLFGVNPNRRVPQAGVTAAAFPGIEKDYNTIDEERIRGPLVPIVSRRGGVAEKGVIDRAVDFVKRNMGSTAWLEGARRVRKSAFPLDAVREAIVNALVHRDYAREGTDVEVSLYSNRLEVISPGRLPNGVTVEKMREGVVRVARNELLKEILRDYRYVEHQGMGVRNRIIESMREHNGTEPDLIEEDDRFMVRLWKKHVPLDS